jgi:arginine decarboxylase
VPSETPLADAVERFLADPGTTFTVPGHKRNPALAYGPLAFDMPLVSGAEDSRMSGRVLEQAEALAARLWDGDWCRFSVAGSTHGNQSLALAIGSPGDSVIVARTLHKSLFAGLVLAGLHPIWVVPDVDPGTGLAGTVPAERVAAALADARQARGVFMVEPSYIGMLSEIEPIAAAAHAAGVPLLVDQAWGGHLGFHPDLPGHALGRGADALVTSSHKTLTAFTQGSLVVARTTLLDRGRLDEAFEMLHTTSPAAVILASTDRARALMEDRGEELLGATIRLVAGARERLRAVSGLHVVEAGDPAKLVLALSGTGADGFAVEADLLQDGIRFEMADRDTLVPVVTLADTAESIDRLATSLERSLARRSGPPRSPSPSAVWSLAPVTVLSPREAFFAPRERVPAAQAVGRVAAETAAPYPPGIPAIAPGELITADLLDALRAEAAAGSRIAYCSDPSLETLLVVAEGRGGPQTA